MNKKINVLKDLGKFKLFEETSKSEEAIIYLGYDDRNDKMVWVKAIPKSSIKSKKQLQELQNQVEILKQLKHENIIRIKAAQQTPNNFYIITEYCNGGKLRDFQKFYQEKKKAQLNEIYIQKIIRQLSSGIEYMHSKNIIHRGISLDNIDLNFEKYPNIIIKNEEPKKVQYSEINENDSFTLKITNMKFSKNLENATTTQTVVGSANMMAPEMMSHQKYNNKIDLWSLGILTYELLTGVKPFEGDDIKEIFNRIKEGKMNLPPTLVASSEIISFINGLLQFYPEKRMDWPQIKTHPFLINKVENFNYIELNKIADIDESKIEKNSKNCDNLLWILYKGKNTEFNFDKINIQLNENEKKEMEKNINENKVSNEAIKKAAEDKPFNIEEEKKRLFEQRKQAEEYTKEGELKLKEANAKKEEKEKLLLKIKELESQLSNNEDENIKKEKEKYQNEVDKIEEITSSADKLFANAQKLKNEAEKKLVLINIQELFPYEKLSALKTEKEVLKFFNNMENDINKYIVMVLGKNEFLKDFCTTKIEEVFKSNNNISEITKTIYAKLETINLQLIKSNDDFNEKIFEIFPDVVLPKFLTAKFLKTIENNSFTKKRNSIMSNVIGTIIKRNFTKQSKSIVEFYESIRDNKIQIFEPVSKKNELFSFFIIVNYNIFQKPYFDTKFSAFLTINDEIIKKVVGSNIKYNELLEKMDDDKINKKREELFNIVKKDINMNTDKILIIIVSFYYLLFYKFKDVKEIKGRNSFGNVYINYILKNFVMYLAKNLENIQIKLINLLNQLISFDFNNNYLDQGLENKNKSYDFLNIKSLMSQCGPLLKKKFENDLKKYDDEINKNAGLLTTLGKKFYDKEDYENIQLISVDDKIFSSTITFIIDMYSKNENRNEWIDFIEYFDKETMFYFYSWSRTSKDELLQKGNYNNMRKKATKQNIISAKTIAKICGIFLADILISNKFFNNFQINLVGFGLGAHVIKYCLKELSKLNGKNNYVKFKNVILIGAATHIKNEDKWVAHLEKTVIGRFINCFSNEDSILENFYYLYSSVCNKKSKEPIGFNTLEIRDDRGNIIVENYDFSNKKYDQLSYELKEVVKTIFPNKEI